MADSATVAAVWGTVGVLGGVILADIIDGRRASDGTRFSKQNKWCRNQCFSLYSLSNGKEDPERAQCYKTCMRRVKLTSKEELALGALG